jgi:lysine 2,3-aminomutase
VPTFDIDLPQGGGKIPVQPNYILTQAGDELLVRNYRGHIYHCHNPRTRAKAKPVQVPLPVPVPVKREGTRDADRLKLRP